MPRPRKPASRFRYFNSSPEVIRLVVMMYVRLPLSLRNVEDLLFERGIDICHETVRHWWNRFGPMFAADVRRQRVSRMKGFRQWKWHLDEVYVKINGEMHYLWRAVDQEGEVLPPGQLGPQCPVGVPSSPPACFDYGYATITTSGGPNLYSPEWTYNFGVEYEIDLGGASLIPRVHYGYVGPRFNYLAYAATDRLAGRGLVSAQAMLEIGDWEIELWANNLTNKVYVSGRSGDNEFVGAPREYGLRLGFAF